MWYAIFDCRKTAALSERFLKTKLGTSEFDISCATHPIQDKNLASLTRIPHDCYVITVIDAFRTRIRTPNWLESNSQVQPRSPWVLRAIAPLSILRYDCNNRPDSRANASAFFSSWKSPSYRQRWIISHLAPRGARAREPRGEKGQPDICASFGMHREWIVALFSWSARAVGITAFSFSQSIVRYDGCYSKRRKMSRSFNFALAETRRIRRWERSSRTSATSFGMHQEESLRC